MFRREQRPVLSILTMVTILASTIIILTEVGSIMSVQGQGNITSSLTPEQKATMCNPNNPKLNFVNSTESKICGIPPTPTNTTNSTTTSTTTPAANNTTTAPTIDKQPPASLYDQGYAKGVADAKSVQITTPPTGTMSPDDIDCDSSIDPRASNPDYCSGYQHGYADTYNKSIG